MIDLNILTNLLMEKREIDSRGTDLQNTAIGWTNALKATVGTDVFTKNGIDWAEVCLKICVEYDRKGDENDRCVCNDRN